MVLLQSTSFSWAVCRLPPNSALVLQHAVHSVIFFKGTSSFCHMVLYHDKHWCDLLAVLFLFHVTTNTILHNFNPCWNCPWCYFITFLLVPLHVHDLSRRLMRYDILHLKSFICWNFCCYFTPYCTDEIR